MTLVAKKVSATVNKVNTSKINKKEVKASQVKKEAAKTTVWADKMAKITAQQEVEQKAKAELKAKEQAEKKRPGVIRSILDIITKSDKPVTQAQILAKLVIDFPKREEKSMTNTIKAQIGGKMRPMRMEREKMVIFNIVTNKAGVKTYSIEHAEEVAQIENKKA